MYRHPVTKKFISKREWESLNKKEVKDGTQLMQLGSDFDVEAEGFLKNIEESFNKKEEEEVKSESIVPRFSFKIYFNNILNKIFNG
jgi:hypothetical protein